MDQTGDVGQQAELISCRGSIIACIFNASHFLTRDDTIAAL
jgi:hypothetical protein